MQAAAPPGGTASRDADPCNGVVTCSGGVCTSSGGPGTFDGGAITVRGNVLTVSGGFAPSGSIAASTTDDVALVLDAGGNAVYASTLAHPASDPLWLRSRPPVLFKYKDRTGGAGGLTLLQMKQHGAAYALKAKGRNDALRSLQGGSIDAKLVVGKECWVASVPCVKKGKALRCR